MRFLSLSALSILLSVPLIRADDVATTFPDGLDPSKNFCMRFWHSSTIKNNVLYIDGGMQGYTTSPNRTLKGNGMGYNYYLESIDLTQSFNWQTTLTRTYHNKNPAPDAGEAVPQVARGGLIAGGPNDGKVYMYGGTLDYWNSSFQGFTEPVSAKYGLWSYDSATQVWDRYDTSKTTPYRPGAGAYADAPNQGLGFYFNGEIDGGSSPDTSGLERRSLEGLVVVNTTAHTTFNVSTSAVTNGAGRSRGGLVYVPGIGTNGILVAVGGSYKPTKVDSKDEVGGWVRMDEILIFDVASLYDEKTKGSNGWHKQIATGEIPSTRRQFCMTLVSAQDGSSHNIYMFGGSKSQSENQFFDDIYVLSLPSFTWTRVFGPGKNPRYGHTCHTAGNRQMIAVGGAPAWGFNDGCDPFPRGVTVYDMSLLSWNTTFYPDAKPYEVPDKITAVIGGSGAGGATVQKPAEGFNTPQLQKVFDPNFVIPPDAPTGPNTGNTGGGNSDNKSSSKLSTGAIVGIVIAIVALIFLAVGAWFFWKRRQMSRHKEPVHEAPNFGVAKYELEDRGKAPPMLDGNELRKDYPSKPVGPTEYHEMPSSMHQTQYFELPADRNK